MDFLNIILLSLVQGLTEFLPVSSSAHLILVAKLADWQDQGLVFDVAAHFGSLLAMLAFLFPHFQNKGISFFPERINNISQSSVLNKNPRELLTLLIVGTIPVGIVGFLCREAIESSLREPWIIAGATIFFGILLWVSDIKQRDEKVKFLSHLHIFIIGCAQCFALVPGASRAGVTMTAALFIGFSRTDALKISAVLAIPVITISVALELALLTSYAKDFYLDLLFVTVGSLISAYFSLHLFFGIIEKLGMLPFLIYRLFLGAFIIAFFYL